MNERVVVRCTACNQAYTLSVTPTQISAWLHNKQCIQDAMPQLTAGECELLLSQTCSRCFDAVFPEED